MDISSDKEFREVTKKSAKKHEICPKTDINSNKIQQAVQISCDQASTSDSVTKHAAGEQQSYSQHKEISPSLRYIHSNSTIQHTLVSEHQSVLGSIVPSATVSFHHSKTDHGQASFPPPLSCLPILVVPVQHALTSTEQCAVMDKQGLTCHLDRSKGGSGEESEMFFRTMEVVRQL